MTNVAPLRVLVVDDEEIIRHLVRRFLTSLGHACDEAENGAEGLEAMAATTYDLVIVDYRMPVMDGFEFLRESRRKYPNIPVALVTGHGTDEEMDEARNLGAILCLRKPFKLDTIKAILTKISKK